MQNIIKLPINYKLIIFLVILEVLTIPIVSCTNTFILKNPVYLLGVGFIAGAFALLIIMKLITPPLQRYLSKLLNIQIIKISGILYIAILSGFLLMFMFYVQGLTYLFTQSDILVGTVSAFFSVGVSLIIYSIITKIFNYGIKIKTSNKEIFLLTILPKDIILITILFTIYETIASPLSIIWLPHMTDRFFWGLVSGVASGIFGGLPLVIISYLTGYKVTIKLISIS